MSYSAADLWNERIDEGLREAVARLVGAAALYDTDTDLEPGEDLTITVTYDDQRALREALSGLVAAHPDLKP